MSKAKALTTVRELKERIDSLSDMDRQKVLRLAYNYNADEIGFIQNMSITTVGALQQMMCNEDYSSILGRRKMLKNATEILAPKFPHWTKERIAEEIQYISNHSTIYYDRLSWELNVIYKHYKENK